MIGMILKAPRPVTENPLEKASLPEPSPGPGHIRLRVLACGVCHTDLHTVEDELDLPKLPVIPGHQIVGVVDRIGQGVTRFQPGDRAGVPWLHSTCGECEYCRQGNENLCDLARFTGLHADGGYAEYAVAPSAFAYPIPEGFTDVQAAPLLCAGIIGYRALRLSQVQPGEKLGLYGFGASAHVTIQVARDRGCEVYVFSRSQEHRRHALKLGAVWTGRAGEDPGGFMHSSIIFAPAGELVPEALRRLRKGGTLALAGIHMSPIPEMEYSLLYHERMLRSIANSTRQDAEQLLRIAAKIPIHTDVQLYPLEQANLALQKLKKGEIRGAAVLQVAEPAEQ